ncbi:FMN-dependent NADH-azoreductase [Flavobacterium sedimenticola]|uniref:FMN dependent NADH:quinone oxidoreductase n=1 Tax=Flavobacterium sedimenticola TaxID=3043286 RepID=A0ABT6XL87_9FLAO|nr:NAD(P)H-dependent oxidoreductase [Flavobacterium sedimenticola]MDI9255848.1 FMN-dependent NADH-azoreductase [Flavobacterium sedimenticola]
MKKILHVMASPRGTASISRQLGDSITAQLAVSNPGSIITTVDLNVNPFPHLFEAQIDALRIPADRLTEAQKELTKRSDEAIAQVLEADTIVISLPLYNFGIPSPLKSWIDNIARAGYTFSYGADGPKGLVEGKKVYIALASGGVFSEGPFKEYDFAVPYLKTVLGFMGITDVEVIRAEGTAVSGLMEHALERAIERIAV